MVDRVRLPAFLLHDDHSPFLFFHVETTFCTIYNAAVFGLPRRGPRGSTTDLDEAGSLAYFFLNFERASQSPAAGGAQAGGDCKGVTICIWTKGVGRRSLSRPSRWRSFFMRLAFRTNFTCFGLRFKSGKPSRPPQAHPIHVR